MILLNIKKLYVSEQHLHNVHEKLGLDERCRKPRKDDFSDAKARLVSIEWREKCMEIMGRSFFDLAINNENRELGKSVLLLDDK